MVITCEAAEIKPNVRVYGWVNPIAAELKHKVVYHLYCAREIKIMWRKKKK